MRPKWSCGEGRGERTRECHPRCGREGRATTVTSIDAIRAMTPDRAWRVHYFDPSRVTHEYRTACDGHPNAAFHEKLAGEILAEIEEQLGW